MLRPGFELASPQDMQMPRCVDNAAQAVAMIRDHQTAQGSISPQSGTSVEQRSDCCPRLRRG